MLKQYVRRFFSVFISLFLFSSLYAQTDGLSYSTLGKVISELSNLAPTEYGQEAPKIYFSLDNFFDKFFKVCRGELSTKVITYPGGALDKKGRKGCFEDFRNDKIKYMKAAYAARTRYLEDSFSKTKKELSQDRDDKIELLKREIDGLL